jgi:predicted N-acetyltransferase YhbS
MNEICLRQMTEADLPAADELSRLAGWNQTLEDWRLLLRLEPEGCFVAAQEAAVVGTVTTICYRHLAWIGMMLVHPERRRQGIATRLMRQAVEYLPGREVKCVKLDATPAGYPVYEKLGFVPEWTLRRWQRPAGSGPVPGGSAGAETRVLEEADWRAAEELDTTVFGASRGQLLRGLARRSRLALAWPAQGVLAGWGLLRPGARADYLGPLTCAAPRGSLALLRSLLSAAGTRSVFWDIPDQNEAATAAAQSSGFTPVRTLTRMRLGPDRVMPDVGAQFAIADPAVG